MKSSIIFGCILSGFGALWSVGDAIKPAPLGGITCVCTLCPNKTCHTDGVCLTQVVRQKDGVVVRWDNCLAKYQLFPPEHPFLCLVSEALRETNAVGCCAEGDLCNRDLNVTLAEPLTLAPASAASTGDPWETSGSRQLIIGIVAAVIVVLVLLAALGVFMWRRHTTQLAAKAPGGKEAMRLLEEGQSGALSALVGEMTTSGSGSGLPLLIQRTIARQVSLINPIGKGRYGEVYLGRWQGENIAVKMFSTRDEASWKREVEMYQTVMLRHENLLGFIAADNKDNGLVTQLWLLTEYHELGSLYDYLTRTPVDVPGMLRLCFSLANGLAHLHMEIVGVSTLGKPAIAHRDLKSKNILVKRNLQCAIADLGLAVAYDHTGHINLPHNDKVGTVRYLPPEVLDSNLNLTNFESIKAVDVYALALVLWEICHRCAFAGPAAEYELPYANDVPGDPDVGQMREVVVVKKTRPSIHNQWSTREPMQTMCRLMRECWYPNPQARLTALRVKKTIAQLVATGDVKI
ncbi:TGF-beta receptor type-1-like [Paramacrobiotus metropolitanus]|uniref:TGF-beta receptor type-1-like n=1 Tax=Paramacrobiotus metropolitanus TaxID=2943436 RepID=UPI002445A0ED|nr:TGF-beta receptor type-1-like [Paramacrobiotus metropolitanus]